jgi:acetyl esterase/lipase
MLADHEGEPIARWLNTLGIAGAVLRYRHAPRYQHPHPLADAARALRTLRARSAAWNLDPNRLGIMGSSAGGHLASTLCTHFDPGRPHADDPIERVSSRPDLAILLYPVITLTAPFCHEGSRQNLLGNDPPPALVNSLCNERQVTPATPPTFIFHTADDDGVPVQNSLMYATACRDARVNVELHVYSSGPHGVGLAADNPHLRTWPQLCAAWLRTRGFASST